MAIEWEINTGTKSQQFDGKEIIKRSESSDMRNKQNKRECLQYVYLSFLVICFFVFGWIFFNRDCITIRPHVFGLSSNVLKMI